MQVKKYPHAVLENYSAILVQLGLVLSLFIVFEFIQMKTYTRDVKEITSTLVRLDKNEQIIEFIPIEIEQKQVTQTVLPDKILKVDDEVEVEETIIESTETDQFDAVVVSPVKDIVAVEEEEEEVVEDVPFMIIENVPKVD